MESNDHEAATDLPLQAINPLQTLDPPASQSRTVDALSNAEAIPNGTDLLNEQNSPQHEVVEEHRPSTNQQGAMSAEEFLRSGIGCQHTRASTSHAGSETMAVNGQIGMDETTASVKDEQQSTASGPRSSVQHTSNCPSPAEDSKQKENLQHIVDAMKIPNGKVNAKATRVPPNKRARNDESSDELPFFFVLGSNDHNREELDIRKDLICRHSSYISQLCEDSRAFRARREAVKLMYNKLRHAVVLAGDHSHIDRPRIEDPSRPLLLYAQAIVAACNDYPWAKTCEYFSLSIAAAFGIPKEFIQQKKKQNTHLLHIIRPAFANIDLPTMRKAIKILIQKMQLFLFDRYDGPDPQSRLRAAAFHRFYLHPCAALPASCADAATVRLLITHLETPCLSCVPCAALCRLARLAAHLRLQGFQNDVCDALRAVSRHGRALLSEECLRVVFAHGGRNGEDEGGRDGDGGDDNGSGNGNGGVGGGIGGRQDDKDGTKGVAGLQRLVADVLVHTQPGDTVMGIVRGVGSNVLFDRVLESGLTRWEQAGSPVGETGPPFLDPGESCRRYHVHEGEQGCV
ncbi:MAG: hypothetical protein M1822_000169 [Bathelium mastoideum]|nr:MAG: hypothetical protein M1822_000169 [Bathelium mastoideum]